MESVKLTQYSHGAGCGCKIAPKVLDEILAGSLAMPDNDRLIVGNHSRDDAAVYDLGNGQALISTTDFFMPIVDDPYEFGRIASANAISDVFAMGGKPILAIAILGWPVNVLPPEIAGKVIEGSRSICMEAGIPLAGGHSIDSPEPIFGLAVNGLVDVDKVKQNNTARVGDLLFLTKPLGVGILTTAEKKNKLKDQHRGIAAKQMMQLNSIGEALGRLEGVHAMTDVTGFGLLGHLVEMADGSNLSAILESDGTPLIIPEIFDYVQDGCVPGGTVRNWASYGHRVTFSSSPIEKKFQSLLADPQTSGGLLVAADPTALEEFSQILADFKLSAYATPVGKIIAKESRAVIVR